MRKQVRPPLKTPMTPHLPLDCARSELILVRHAPADTGGRLCGRVGVPARLDDGLSLARISAALAGVRQMVTSPALRCRQTADALFADCVRVEDARLWEQCFGAEDGMSCADLPDLGPLSRNALATRRPPGGERFADMVARVTPALARALGSVSAAPAFEVAPLSLTRLRCLDDGRSVIGVNLTL